MTQLQVRVFGPLQVSLDGHAARIGAGRQQAVLGRLVLAGGKTIAADRLAEDVWEGAPPPHASSVLQVQVHNLRRVLEPHRRPRTPARILVSEAGGYALRLDATNVDAWRFEQLLRQYEQKAHAAARPDAGERYRMLDEALHCWRGTAFESFASASWATAEVARLTDLRITATEMRAEAALELGRVGEVVAVLRQQVEEYPGREESARLLALAQHRLGQQIEALATVRRTRDYLRSEFGIDPGQRLCELESAILNQTVDEGRECVPVIPEEPVRPRIPISRDERPGRASVATSPRFYPAQRRMINATAAEACADGLRVIWLMGESGTGKTALVSGIAIGLAEDGWATAFGRCPEVDGAPPAWVWTEILAELEGAVLDSRLAAVPDSRLAAVPDSRPAPLDPFTIVQAVTARGREITARMPLAIFVEDAHRADAATLQVLRQLATWLHREPILVVLTVRGGEPTPALRATEAALVDRATARVQLAGLDLAGTREVAEQIGLTDLDEDSLRALHRRTGGNPLFIRELSKLLVAGGDPKGLPESIRAVLIERIERLPTGVLAVLQHIAVWGKAIDLDTLAELSGVGEEELVDLVDTAVAADLLVFDARGRMVPDHPLIQDAVYNSIAPLRRSRMHWNTVEFIQHRATGHDSDLVEVTALAHHAARGATRTTAAYALGRVVAAARTCENLGMRADATRWWRTAVGLHELADHTVPSAPRADREMLLDTLCAFTGALANEGCVRSARAVRDRALDVAEALSEPEQLLRALTCWRAPTLHGVRDWCLRGDRVRTAVEAVLAGAHSPRDQAWLLVTLVFESELDADPDVTRGHARRALELASPTGDLPLICAALHALAHTVSGPARLDGWRPVADELMRAARGGRSLDYQSLAHFLRFRAACHEVDLAAAGRHAIRALECAISAEFRQPLDQLLAFPAVAAVLLGDLDAAERRYRRYVTRTIRPGVANEEFVRLTAALTLAWARGDLSVLLDRLALWYEREPALVAQVYVVALLHAGSAVRAREVFHENPVVAPYFHWPVMAAFRGWAALALRELDAARELYDALTPHSGTIIGFDSGAAAFGPMDALLGDLAEVLGDSDAAALRTRATLMIDSVRTSLRSLSPVLDSIEDLCADPASDGLGSAP
ncbi:BTAD domain-containing putative transcriptional regulator [Nocardia bovistercoris]|uniref:AAA family ATPase n=1 Tax=Nocardia bovistercoris TaxID=2785916 RepID=A0A931I8L3_9NOCA|nr:BTAD domain-containing putative transcriptional regulator [Nocardia bovistercoris]MBH0776952.1 AAA family ATPase [Nocardia bovistercoris]